MKVKERSVPGRSESAEVREGPKRLGVCEGPTDLRYAKVQRALGSAKVAESWGARRSRSLEEREGPRALRSAKVQQT